MAREIINDLADIIRDHQDTLPNLEELDVKDKFKEVYKETEDGNLVIENDMHMCTGLRKVHIDFLKRVIISLTILLLDTVNLMR